MAGGLDSTNYLIITVELLFLNGSSSFVFGKDLQHPIMDPSMVAYNNSVILVGGWNGPFIDFVNLYRLDSPDGNWIMMNQTLAMGKGAPVAFLVPDHFVTCN